MKQTQHAKLIAAVGITAGIWVAAMTVLPATAQADNSEMSDSATAESVEPASTKPEFTEYTVKPGDYLEAIATEHDVNWPSIYERNQNISNPDLIYPEQSLEIPSEDIPLTRSLAGSTLVVPETYAPQPVAPTQSAPNSQTVEQNTKPAQSTGYAAPKKVNRSSVAGVVGLEQVLNSPYVYGGNTLAGFDCSGLTQYLASLKGVQLPRTSQAQYHATARIGLSDLAPGDLVFFNWGHVGMYIGGGQVVHATNPQQGVRIDNLQTAIQYNGYLGAGAL